MIEAYVKSGKIGSKSAVAIILKSQRYRWLKTRLMGDSLTKKQSEALGVMFCLKHIRKKYTKKPVRVYVDSDYIFSMMNKKDGDYARATSVEATKTLRLVADKFNELTLEPMPDDEDAEELLHVYRECGLDGIELDEKD